MGEPNFTIAIDPGRKLLRITLRGFWDIATMDAYDAELRRVGGELTAAGHRREELIALVDARALSVQSQDLISTYKDRFGGAERHGRRVATLASSVLFKKQAERIAFPNQRIYMDEEEALAWLMS